VNQIIPKKSETLPSWDLSDLYASPDDAALKKDLLSVGRKAKNFHKKFRNKIKQMDGAALARSIVLYEKIDEDLSRIMSYAQLVHAGQVTDSKIGKFYQTIQERVMAISANLVFFTIELNAIGERSLSQKLKSNHLKNYASWLSDLRAFRNYQLDEKTERLLIDKQISGRSAWNRLFDETMARMSFRVMGKQKTIEQVLNMLSDSDGKNRKAGAKALGKELEKKQELFALITNTLAKDKEIEDRWRGYPSAQSSRNLSNQVDDEVVNALTAAVKTSYTDLSHRYYKLKAEWFGKRALDYWDRNAPLPNTGNTFYSWDDAKALVIEAYTNFSPKLGSIGKLFFVNNWIDAEPRAGKMSGAFAHPTVPSAHPYLLLNFMGRPRDVMTLAHELGHGIHQILAGAQGHLKCETPLTLAETASVFGEMLTFRSLLDQEKDPAQRKTFLAGKVEDMLNTVVRQIAFYDFELRVHEQRRQGELSVDQICDIWLTVQSESLGPAIRLHNEYKYFWCYIPHFIHSPFYVYAYAFGDCLVNALYSQYEKSKHGFSEHYIKMLKAGGTLRHKELLAPFNLDASDPLFWSKGLGVIANLIDQLEELG
tara:strand:- start:16130 stop:17914 length:1785 start_codon:yes stop_codon:yes gene_type:complete